MNIHAALVAVFVTGALAQAQMRMPKAEVTPLVATDGVHAGSTIRLALRVVLPGGLHTQSNKPRDPNLIPTSLTFDATPGITAREIVYPKATDLAQAGQSEPLVVFEQSFLVGASLAISPGVVGGELVVPARFHYQACDAASCYPPATIVTRWTLRIVPSSVPTPPLHSEVFEQIRFAAAPRP